MPFSKKKRKIRMPPFLAHLSIPDFEPLLSVVLEFIFLSKPCQQFCVPERVLIRLPVPATLIIEKRKYYLERL